MGSVCDGYDGCFQKPEFTKTTHTHTYTSLITHLDGRLNTGDRHKQGTHPHTLSHTRTACFVWHYTENQPTWSFVFIISICRHILEESM